MVIYCLCPKRQVCVFKIFNKSHAGQPGWGRLIGSSPVQDCPVIDANVQSCQLQLYSQNHKTIQTYYLHAFGSTGEFWRCSLTVSHCHGFRHRRPALLLSKKCALRGEMVIFWRDWWGFFMCPRCKDGRAYSRRTVPPGLFLALAGSRWFQLTLRVAAQPQL